MDAYSNWHVESLHRAIMSLFRFARPSPIRRPLTRHFASWVRRPHTRYLACSVATVAVVAYLAYPPRQIHLDSPQYGEGETKCMSQVIWLFRPSMSWCIVDPATTIAFPKLMHVPSNVGIPPLPLVGLGVRTVSFLGISVYSVAFYADLNNPNLKVSHLHVLPLNRDHSLSRFLLTCLEKRRSNI